MTLTWYIQKKNTKSKNNNTKKKIDIRSVSSIEIFQCYKTKNTNDIQDIYDPI